MLASCLKSDSGADYRSGLPMVLFIRRDARVFAQLGTFIPPLTGGRGSAMINLSGEAL